MVILRENHKNDNNLGEFQNFYELTLNMNFANLQKMAILTIAIFIKKIKNHMQGASVKFILVIIIVIFPQKWQF